MANHYSVTFFLLAALTIFIMCSVSANHSVSTAMAMALIPSSPESESPSTALEVIPSPPEPPSMNVVIDALLRHEVFAIWGKWLAAHSTRPSFVLPINATLLVPMNGAVLHLRYAKKIDPLLIPYHIIPQRLSYQDLRLLKPFSHLPTLVPFKTILITNTSAFNFIIQDSVIVHPNMYLESQVAIHGINRLLNYTLYH